MAETADAGTIQINLALNLAPLEKGVQDANKKIGSISSVLEKQFAAAGGVVGNFGERIGNVGKNIKKMFGDDAPRYMQDFGKEMQRSLGLSDKQVKGLAQSAEALEGAFKLAGQAIQLIVSPLGVALALAMSLVTVFGAVRNAIGKITASGNEKSGGIWNTLKEGWNDSIGGRAINGVKSWYDKQASTPGTVAESISKIDPIKDLMDGFKSGLDGIGPLLDEVKKHLGKFLTPGDSKKDLAAKDKKLDRQMDDALDALEKEQLEAAREFVDGQEQALDAWTKWQDAERDLIKNKFKWSQDANEKQKKIEEDRLAHLKEINENSIENLKKEYEESMQRMRDFAQGRWGSAIGLNGTVGGAALNVMGTSMMSKAGPITQKVVSSASEGYETSGSAYGAIVGAILGLVSEMKIFSAIMEAIEKVLGNIVDTLNLVVRDIEIAINNMNGTTPKTKSAMGGVGGGEYNGYTFTMRMWTAYYEETLQNLKDSALESKKAYAFLKQASQGNHEAYMALYSEYSAERDRQREEEKLYDSFEERYNAENGITEATVEATKALRTFSDSLINAAPGYRLAATGYNSQQAGGPTQGMSGSGGLFNQPVQVYVTLDGQQLAASVEYRQSRNQGMLGSSLATRGPLGLGG